MADTSHVIDLGFCRVVNLWWFASPFALFDITLSFWLRLKGLRGPAEALRPTRRN